MNISWKIKPTKKYLNNGIDSNHVVNCYFISYNVNGIDYFVCLFIKMDPACPAYQSLLRLFLGATLSFPSKQSLTLIPWTQFVVCQSWYPPEKCNQNCDPQLECDHQSWPPVTWSDQQLPDWHVSQLCHVSRHDSHVYLVFWRVLLM